VIACPSCSAELEDDANFCHVCGADLREATRVVPSQPSADVQDAETTVMEATPTDPDVTSAMAYPGDEDPTDPGDPPQLTADATQVIDASGTGTRACPSCGANNSSRRELCGRCGANLSTGEIAPRPAPRPIAPAIPAEPRASERDRATRGRTIALIVAAGLIVGTLTTLVGLVWLLPIWGIGPFAEQDTLPSAVFDPVVYGEETVALPPDEVATRTLKPAVGGVDFSRESMFDGDLATAWANSGDTNRNGVGEVIRVRFSSSVWVTEVVLANGHQADATTFTDRARLRRVTARVDGDVVVGLVFLDTEGQQAVRFPEPLLTTAIRLEVEESFEGATSPDLAVSELSFRGHIAQGADIERAQERAQRAPTPG
jgi:hypothetical protein